MIIFQMLEDRPMKSHRKILRASIGTKTNKHNEGSNNIFRNNPVDCSIIILTIKTLKVTPMAQTAFPITLQKTHCQLYCILYHNHCKHLNYY